MFLVTGYWWLNAVGPEPVEGLVIGFLSLVFDENRPQITIV